MRCADADQDQYQQCGREQTFHRRLSFANKAGIIEPFQLSGNRSSKLHRRGAHNEDPPKTRKPDFKSRLSLRENA
jgi:hypothetical protein